MNSDFATGTCDTDPEPDGRASSISRGVVPSSWGMLFAGLMSGESPTRVDGSWLEDWRARPEDIFPRTLCSRALDMNVDSVPELTILLNQVPLWLSEASKLLLYTRHKIQLKPRQYAPSEHRNTITVVTANPLLMVPVLKVNVMRFVMPRSVVLNPVRDLRSPLIIPNVMKRSQTAEEPVQSVARYQSFFGLMYWSKVLSILVVAAHQDPKPS